MTFKQGLLHARSHIIFVVALIVAFTFIIHLEKLEVGKNAVHDKQIDIEKTYTIDVAENSFLNEQELTWANIAWRYFENNYQVETGLVNSVDQYPATTLWDQSSYILGMIAAYRLDIIDQETFNHRIVNVLKALEKMPLYDEVLPNKSYNTTNLKMVDYNNQATEKGIGWSAIDIARLMVPLNIILWNYPEHGPAIKSVIDRWDISMMIDNGVLMGATIEEGKTKYVQEGRIGYEEYASRAMALMGYDVAEASQYRDFLEFIDIEGIPIPTDSRDPAIYEAHNYVVSESYILQAIEFGLDHHTKEFAYRVYKTQEERYQRTGILTAVSEDNIDRPPYFVYNTVFSSGKIWNAITDTGDDASAHKTLSTKAAFGWDQIFKTQYSNELMKVASTLYDKDKGWYSGFYEVDQQPNKAITANTNAVILESLYYRQFGPMIGIHKDNINPEEENSEQLAGK